MTHSHQTTPRSERETQRAILSVIKAVAETAGLSAADFLPYDRRVHVLQARHLAIFMVRDHFPRLTLVQIGEIFHRDHGAVINSIRTHADLLKHDPGYQTLHLRLQEKLSTFAA